MRIQGLYRESITQYAEARYKPYCFFSHVAVLAYPLLTGENIADVDFNDRQAYPGYAVGKGQAGVGVGPSIEDHPMRAFVLRLFQAVYQSPFVVVLIKDETHTIGIGSQKVTYLFGDNFEPLGTVYFGLALSQTAEIWAVKDQKIVSLFLLHRLAFSLVLIVLIKIRSGKTRLLRLTPTCSRYQFA